MSGIVAGIRPRVQALFSVRSLGVSGPVWFTIDSGSSFSAISEVDATLIGIECSSLPFRKIDAIGFGGFFKPRMIDKEIELTFVTDSQSEYKITRSGFVVTCPPDNIEKKTREKMMELTPSVLGMDILSRFDIHIYKKRVELDIREHETL